MVRVSFSQEGGGGGGVCCACCACCACINLKGGGAKATYTELKGGVWREGWGVGGTYT